MKLQLSDEDVAFRDEMRTFFTTQIPQDIRDTVTARRELSKDQIVRSMQAMNAAGIAVPNWPVEWGGKDWTPLQRHIWHEEMQLAGVMPPLA
ncbi:MAG: acyl-CoA dehydrogenase family protein, partial [Aeromicrobium sp.]